MSRRPSLTPCPALKAALPLALALAVAPMLAHAARAVPAAAAGDWPMFGQNLDNSASAAQGGVLDASRLVIKWSFKTGGDVSARAAVVGGVAYFPDWGGNLWALGTSRGAKVWGHQLSDYGLPAGTRSRTSPLVANGVVYVGTQQGAWLLAIDAASGNLLWKTQLESAAEDSLAQITASPVISGGLLYTGLASNQEGAAGSQPGFVCCSARGSAVAVHINGKHKGEIAWRTYTVPAGYSGGGVWGSNFAIDVQRGSVFLTTGNNYSSPTDPAYLDCRAIGGSAEACQSPDNHVDSVLALDLASGAIRWARRFVDWEQDGVADGSDDWNTSCFTVGAPNCPIDRGPDYDFASAPNLIHYTDTLGHPVTILGAGQKSGLYYALDPDTGATIWQTQIGPGSNLGGMAWGSATDGTRIYVSVANGYRVNTAVGDAGSWAALDPATGHVLWQVGEPNSAVVLGPLAVSNGAVYAASMAGTSTSQSMFALDAATGQTLWSYAPGSSVNAGATIVGGDVFWGSGYARLNNPTFTGNNRFWAFTSRSGSHP